MTAPRDLQGFKFVDNVFDGVGEFEQRAHHLSAPKLDWRTLAKLYLEGHSRFVLELEWSIPLPDCWAVFTASAGLKEHLVGYEDSPSLILSDKVIDRTEAYGGQDQFVLVENIETVKGPEGVIPSFVWFQRLKRVNYYGSAPAYLVLRKSLPESLDIAADRKMYMRGGSIRTANKLRSQKVKSGSEIVNAITDDERNLIWKPMPDLDLKAVLASIFIRLDDKSIGVGASKRFDGLFKIRNVMVGPLDF